MADQALIDAARRGDLAALERALAEDADPTAFDHAALHAAAMRGHTACMHRLIPATGFPTHVLKCVIRDIANPADLAVLAPHVAVSVNDPGPPPSANKGGSGHATAGSAFAQSLISCLARAFMAAKDNHATALLDLFEAASPGAPPHTYLALAVEHRRSTFYARLYKPTSVASFLARLPPALSTNEISDLDRRDMDEVDRVGQALAPAQQLMLLAQVLSLRAKHSGRPRSPEVLVVDEALWDATSSDGAFLAEHLPGTWQQVIAHRRLGQLAGTPVTPVARPRYRS